MIPVLAGFMVLSVVETSARHITASDAAAPNVGRAIFFVENDCNCPRGIVDASSRQGTSLPSGEGFRDELHLHICGFGRLGERPPECLAIRRRLAIGVPFRK